MNVNIMLSNLKPHLWEMMVDSVRFVAGALEECGVPVRIGTSQLDSGAINLFFEREKLFLEDLFSKYSLYIFLANMVLKELFFDIGLILSFLILLGFVKNFLS